MWLALTLGLTNNADSIVQEAQPIHGANWIPGLERPILTRAQHVQVTKVGQDVRIAVHSQGGVETHVYHRDNQNLDFHKHPHEEYPHLTKQGGSWEDLSRAYQVRINKEDLSLLGLADAVRRDKELSSGEKKKIFKRIEEGAAVNRKNALTEWETEVGAHLYDPNNSLPVREIFVSHDEANSMLRNGFVAVNTAFTGARETLKMVGTPEAAKQASEKALNLVSKAGVDCDKIIGVKHLIDDRGQREQVEEVVRKCDEAVRELRRSTNDGPGVLVRYRRAIDCMSKACDAIYRVHLKKDCVKKGGNCSFHPIYPFYPKHHKHHKKTKPAGGSAITPIVTPPPPNQPEPSDIAQDAERQRVGAILAPLCFVDDNETDDSEVGNRRISTQCCQTSDLDSDGKPIATQCCSTGDLDEDGKPVLKPCSESAKGTGLKPA
jgi:hypothetical protein